MIEEGNDQPKVISKRVKVEGTMKEGEDRISELPDGLLVEILSRLPSTKSAIQTGILSKRWKYVWTSVSSFIFTHFHIPSSDFVSLVEKTLSQCRPSKLRKFVVVTDHIPFGSQVHDWIRYAISCNVEELNVTCKGCDHMSEQYVLDLSLDEDFLVNSYFTDLNLSCCIFNPTGAISWKSLKRLSINYCSLEIDGIYNILSGSPLLENLELYDSFGDWQLGITSKSIKRLVLSGPGLSDEELLQTNNFIRYAIRHNLEDLDLSYFVDYFEAVTLLIEDVFINSCFTNLRLTCCIFKPKGAIDWERLRTLYINCGSLDEDVIENILSGSPQLETLVLDDCYGYSRLDIVSKSVKKLEFCRYSCCVVTDFIELNAPNILSLKIQGPLHLLKLSLSSVPSLVEAKLDIYSYHEDMPVEEETTPAEEEEIAKGFIRSLRHVKKIKFENRFCEAMLKEYMQAMRKKYKRAMFKKRRRAMHAKYE